MIKFKNKKRLYSGIAGLMTVAIVGTSIYFSGEKVMAKETFQGITEIVEENSEGNPFTIVEVTPGKAQMTIDPKDGTDPVTLDVSVGEMGYYIEGAENANFGDNLGYFNSTEGRYIYADTLIKAENGAITGGALQSITSYENDGSLPLYYIPYEEDYNLSEADLQVSGDEIPWRQVEPREGHEEQVITRKEMVTSLNGRFVKTYSPQKTTLEGTRDDFVNLCLTSEVSGNYAGTSIPVEVVNGDGGDFDPLFVSSEKNGYMNAWFVPNDARCGYYVNNAIRVDPETAEDTYGGMEGTYIYEKCYNTEGAMFYRFAGKYADLRHIITGKDEEVTGAPDDTDDIVDDEEGRERVGDDSDVEEVASEEEVEIEGSEGDLDQEEFTDSSEDGNAGNDESQDVVDDSADKVVFEEKPEEKSEDENTAEGNNTSKKKHKKGKKSKEKSSEIETEARAMRSFAAHDVPSDSDEESGDSLTKFLEDAKDGHEDDEEVSDDSQIEEMDDSSVEAEEVSGIEEEVNVSGTEEDEDRVYEEDVIDELPEEDVSGFETDNAEGSGEYYVLDFAYDREKINETTYSIGGLESIVAGTAAYAFMTPGMIISTPSAEQFIVPNFAHTGLFKSLNETDFRYVSAPSKTDQETQETTWYGNYDMIDPAAGEGGKYRVKDVQIYYKGVYGNSNWFTLYVFDRDTAYVYDTDGTRYPTMYYYYEETTADELYSMDMGLLYINSGKGNLLPQDSEYVTVSWPNEFGYGKASGSEGEINDISFDAMFDAIQAFAKTDFPIMADYALLGDAYNDTNIQHLTKLLNLDDVYQFAESVKSWSPSELGGLSFASDSNGYYTMVNDDKYSCFQLTPKNHHVNRSIYIYNYSLYPDLMINDHFLSVDPEYNYLSGSGGFDEIYDEIDAENRLRETNAGKSGFAEIPKEVNEAVAIKYIISYAGRRAAYVKDETNVLEIQPRAVYQEVNDKKGEEGNLYVEERDGEYYLMRVCPGEDAEIFFSKNEINLTSMSVSEFVGMDADLNSNYDLIYIGLSNTHFNVDIDGRTVFNDTDMDGMLYANIGDKYNASCIFAGILSREWNDWSEANGYTGTSLKWNGNSWEGYIETRGPGNDLSKRKYDALMDFVDGGYPVLVDYNCFTGPDSDYNVFDGKIGDDPKKGYIDNCSQMYKFLHDASDEYGINEKNFFRITKNGGLDAAVAGQKTATGYNGLFNWYMQLPKPLLDIGENRDETYTNADKHGDSWYFDIPIKIYDDRSTNDDETYDIEFYIDRNNDGKYSEIPFPTYKDKGEKVEKKRYSIKKEGSDSNEGLSDGKFKLKKKKNYMLTFKLDENIHDGPMAYKVIAKLNKPKSSDDYDLETRIANARRDEKIGCYYIDRSDEIKYINVLQIYPDDECGWYMADTYDGKHTKSMGNNAGGAADIDNWFQGVAENYKVTFTSISSADFINVMYPNGNFLNDFNVLVLGFKKEPIDMLVDAYGNSNPTPTTDDSASGISGDALKLKAATFAADRVQEWVESKKSTIIGSSVVTFMSGVPSAVTANGGALGNAAPNLACGYDTTKRLRAYAGQDRYGAFERPGWGRSSKGLGVQLAKVSDTSTAKPSAFDANNEYGVIYALKPNSRSSDKDDPVVINKIHGLTYNVLNGYNPNGNKSSHSLNQKGDGQVTLEGNPDLKAHRLNVGSITMYPNKVTKTMTISDEVRFPMLQLDLESDDDHDSQSDVSVWLAFSSDDDTGGYSIYKKNGWDARNQYYMYTKQNLTYINCAKVPHTTNEQNLWVNAIINTFEAGAGSLSVHIEEPGTDADGNEVWEDIDTYYLPLETTLADGAEGEEVPLDDEYQTVYFNPRDFKEGATTVLANMYYICPEDKGGTFDISINDYVKPLELPLTNVGLAEKPVISTKSDIPVSITAYDDDGHPTVKTEHYVGYKLNDASTGYRYSMDVPLSLFSAIGDDANELTIYVKCTAISGGSSGVQSVMNAYDSVKIIKTELFQLD